MLGSQATQCGGKLGSTRRSDLDYILRGRSPEPPLILRGLFEGSYRRGCSRKLEIRYLIDFELPLIAPSAGTLESFKELEDSLRDSALRI